MSSPTILIGKQVPRLVAIQRNRDEVDSLLAKIAQVYSSLANLNAQTIEAGGRPLAPGLMSFEQARARAEQLFTSGVSEGGDAGWSAVTFLHAYWQALKHNDLDKALKQYADATTSRASQALQDEQQLAAFTNQVFARVQVRTASDTVKTTAASAGPLFQWNEILKSNLDAIAKYCTPSQVDEIAARVAAIEHRPKSERILALEALRLSIEQQAKLKHEGALVRAFKEKQSELAAEAARIQINRCQQIAEDMDLSKDHAVSAELAALQSVIAGPGAGTVEDRVAALEKSLLDEKSRQGLLQATIQSLRRQGYERVEVMATLNPGDIGPVYLADPQDPDRMTLLMVDEDEGLVAAEVVSRVPVHESQLQKQLDIEAQKRLCHAMQTAHRVIKERFTCEMEQTPPGKPVAVDPRLAHIPAKQRAGAARAQQKQARRLV